VPRPPVAILLPLLVIAFAAACGGGTRKVQSKVTLNQDYDFETAETFTVVPLAPPDGLGQGGPEFAARYDIAFANALRNELASRGLRESRSATTRIWRSPSRTEVSNASPQATSRSTR